MIHHVALMGLLALTHIVCFAVMTERKYTVGKTLAYYAGFAAWFIGWTLLISAWIGANSPCTAPAMFCGTIVAGFAVFMLTSADALCKKLFLFINYSSVFCILYCLSVLIGDALFPALSGNRSFYARNITRTLLYIPTVLLYLKFVRPRVRTVPPARSAPGCPSRWCPCCFWPPLRRLWCFSIPPAAIRAATCSSLRSSC